MHELKCIAQNKAKQSKAKQRVRHGRWWANFWTLSHLLHLLFSVKCSWFISTIFVLNATHFNWLWSLIKFMEFKRTNERTKAKWARCTIHAGPILSDRKKMHLHSSGRFHSHTLCLSIKSIVCFTLQPKATKFQRCVFFL